VRKSFKSWLAKLGFRLWYSFTQDKKYIVFYHSKCGESVMLAHFRPFIKPEIPEFQCFKCHALVAPKDVNFRILSKQEVESIKKEEASHIIPHIIL